MGRRTLIRKSTRRKLWQNWGYLLLPVILWGWFFGSLGAGPLAVMSTLSLGFVLFQARVPCGAETRQRDRETNEYQLCRNNAHGILGGCRQYEAHKWGNAKLLITTSTWGRFLRSLLRKTSRQAAAVSALAGSVSAVIALGALVVAALRK